VKHRTDVRRRGIAWKEILAQTGGVLVLLLALVLIAAGVTLLVGVPVLEGLLLLFATVGAE
jgi:hypothetical protein